VGPNESCVSIYVIRNCELATEGHAYRQLGLLYILLLFPFMFVAYSKDLIYMLCVTGYCRSGIKSVCLDECVLRCNVLLLDRWLLVFIPTQCIRIQG
jgi:hypothetical protein